MMKLTDEDRRQMPRAERIELFLAEAKRLTERPDGLPAPQTRPRNAPKVAGR